jgi:hypothetical protein
MARAQSIYERRTSSKLPLPQDEQRFHTVIGNESLMSISNREYGLREYDKNKWRAIGETNGVTNPFTFSEEFSGDNIVIPSLPLPDFV